MKINIVIPSTVLGGGVRVLFIYANALTDLGHDVVVYLPLIYSWKAINGGVPNLHTTLGNSIKRGSTVPWFSCKFPIKRVPLIINRFIRDADITIASAWYTAQNIAELSPAKGKKVYFIQGYELNENGDNKADVEKSYCLIDNNITIAHWLDTLVSDITGKRTFVLLNGIDDNEFIRGEKKTNDRKTVIMLGNMASHKGTKNGIQVLKQMQKEHNIRVIIYAATPSAEIPESFEFYCQPKRSELMKLYEEADICLFPSIREGWGLTVTEAMAHKCAVVGNPTGALNEIGVDGVNAIFSDGPSVNALYNALEKLLNDEGLMKKIQDSGYRTVSDLKISKQVEKLEKYLKHIVGGVHR